MIDYITDIETLVAHYGTSSEASLIKVTDRLTSAYCRWIEASRFCILTTVGPEGTDGSPRGDIGAVLTILDDRTLAMPDWRGNNRLDSLRNIVRDGRVSLMVMVPGLANVIRVNGTARLTADAELRVRYDRGGKQPATVIVIQIAEVYSQCARAILRSQLWGDQVGPDLPSPGEILSEIKDSFDGAKYDADWGPRAAKTMW